MPPNHLNVILFKGREPPPLPTTDLLSWVFDTPDYDVDKPICIDANDTTRSLSFSQGRELVQKYIAGFRHLGVQPGDCILLHAFNDIHYIPLALSIIGCGAIFACSNPAYTPFELEHHIKVTGATWILPEPETLPIVRKATKAASIPDSHIIIFHPLPTQVCPPNFTSYVSLLNHGISEWKRFDSYQTSKTTTVGRYTSSGTSGLPKACINTNLNVVAQHEYNWSPQFYKPRYDPVRHLWPLPLFHAAISPRALTSIWKLGETVYIMRRFDADAYVRNIERFQITDLVVVPPMAVAVLNHPAIKSGTVSLKSVRSGIAGAAPMTKELQRRFVNLLADDVSLNQVWGMTEANCLGARFEWDQHDDTGSVGWLCPGMEAKLLDVDTGQDLTGTPEVRGEMCVRGECIVPGYYGASGEQANKKNWDQDGYYHSGDVMFVDGKTGKWYVVDRVKELIKSRGFQVAPPEIEGVLLTLEGVLDVPVIGVKDESGEGEVCRAYIVRREGSEDKVTEEVAKKWVSERLIKYKWLEGGVRFVASIPKTPSGKILKRLLREEAENESKTSKL